MKFDSIREAAPTSGEVAAAAGTGAGTAAAVKGVQAATRGSAAKAAAPVAAQAAKAAAPGLLKTAGGAAMKALPGLGAVYGGYDAYQRAKKGDYLGAGLAAAGGLASFVPGLGTAANLGIQGALVGRDVYSAMNEPETPAAPAAAPAKPAAPAARPAGDPNVKALQDRLIAAGAKIKADGIMGPQTQAAMKQFPTAVAEGEENHTSNNPRVERMLKQLRIENPHAQTDIEAILFDYLKNEIEDKREIQRLDMENDMEEADIDQLQKQVGMLQRKIAARKGATLEAKPMSAQERLYQRHQALRKKSGLPDPQYYKDLGEKLRKEIAQLRQEIGDKKDDKLTEFAPGSGDDRDDMNWTMLINMLFRVLNRKGFDFNAEQNYAVFAKGNHLLILEYDTDQPGHFSWRIGVKQPTRSQFVHKVRDIETGTDPISPGSVEGLLVKLADALSQGMAEGGPFSYGAKKPRKGSVADFAAKKRKEQERDKQPAEPKDHMVGVARVKKDVAEGKDDLSQYSTERLKAYVKKVSGGGVPAFGSGAKLKRVQAELKRREQGVAEGLNEFAPGGEFGGGPSYFLTIARAWYHHDLSELGKLIRQNKGKSAMSHIMDAQLAVEKMLDKGILAPDGVKRRYIIDYNSSYDGVIIISDDFYNHAENIENGGYIDDRTGKPFGEYDRMEFSDEQLRSGMLEGAKNDHRHVDRSINPETGKPYKLMGPAGGGEWDPVRSGMGTSEPTYVYPGYKAARAWADKSGKKVVRAGVSKWKVVPKSDPAEEIFSEQDVAEGGFDIPEIPRAPQPKPQPNKGMSEEAKKGLYYYVNKRKKAGTSRPAGHPKAPTAQAWKDAAKTAKTEAAVPATNNVEDAKQKAIDYIKQEGYGRLLNKMSIRDILKLIRDEKTDYSQDLPEGLRDPKDNPCWKGYHPVGTKQKGGRTVPNCVPN